MRKEPSGWLGDFMLFFVAVIHQWKELVMGSLIMAGAWYYQSVAGWNISNKVNLGLAVVFLLIAVFGAWRSEHKRHREVGATLQSLNRSPTVQILEPTESGLIGVKVSNLGEKEIRVVFVTLSLTDIRGETEFSKRLCMSKSKRVVAFPHIMPPGSSFEVMFYHSLNGFLQWGIKAFHAMVETEVGPVVRSSTKDISNLVPENCILARRLKLSLEREARIVDFVENYEFEHKANMRGDLGEYFPAILRAEITKLQDNTEVRDAFERLSARNFSHPFNGVGIEADILGFFQGAEASSDNLSGMDGEFRFFYWRTENERHLTQLPNKESSQPESSSSRDGLDKLSYEI